MRVLNLYAGIGGNRKLWTDVEVVAVENEQYIADAYKALYPDDEVVVADAHLTLGVVAVDDHNSPGFVINEAKNEALVFYTQHNNDNQIRVHRIDLDTFTQEQEDVIKFPCNSPDFKKQFFHLYPRADGNYQLTDLLATDTQKGAEATSDVTPLKQDRKK